LVADSSRIHNILIHFLHFFLYEQLTLSHIQLGA
jgi:hypothetical protein